MKEEFSLEDILREYSMEPKKESNKTESAARQKGKAELRSNPSVKKKTSEASQEQLKARPASPKSREQRRTVEKPHSPKQRTMKSSPKKRKKKTGWALSAAILLLLFLGVFAAGLYVTENGKIYPNVWIDTVNVGDKTEAEATALLVSAGWQEKTSQKLLVNTYCDVQAELNPVEAGLILDAQSAIDAAMHFGREGNVFQNLLSYLRCRSEKNDVNEANTGLKEEYIEEKANEIAQKVNAALEESEVQIDLEKKECTMVKGWGSIELDLQELKDQMKAALLSGQTELNFSNENQTPVCPDFQQICEEISCEPVNAGYAGDGSHEVIPETVGRTFDPAEAESLWEAAAVGDVVHIPLTVTAPEITEANLEELQFRDLLGAVTTKYNNSNENRSSNVRLATSKVDGTILYPGEEFSFNTTVGVRTEEAGFLYAPAYAGYDDIQEEIGGGVCQVSTGVYAASLFSFLEIVKHTSHIYPPNYIQLGMDATVTIPESGGRSIDLVIRNNKAYPIKIVGYCDEYEENGRPRKLVTIEIWGTLEEDDFMPIEFDNSYSDIYDYDRVIEPAYEDREGYIIKFTHEETEFKDDTGKGLRTLTHRKVIDSSGNIVQDHIINPTYSAGYAMDTYYYKG